MRFPSNTASVLTAVAVFALLSITLMGCPPPEEDLGLEELAPDDPDPIVRTDPVGPEVTLREGEIDMPSVFPTGQITLQVVNEGSVDHSLAIAGEGVEHQLAAPLAPGEEAVLELDLVPGSYEAWCPVADHREQGMETTFTVE